MAKGLIESSLLLIPALIIEVLREEIFDYKKQLAFGVFCIKESTQNIKKSLEIEFNNYFKPAEK